MTDQPEPSVFNIKRNMTLEARRSQCLDACARFEVAVLKFLRRVGKDSPQKGCPFSQRLKEVAALPDTETCSGKSLAKAKKLASECEPLLRIRASLVHSALRKETIGNRSTALFQNALDAADGVPQFLVMTEEDFDQLEGKFTSLTQNFDALAKPSSPPQPAKA